MITARVSVHIEPFLTIEWLLAETNDPNTPYIVLGAFQIIGGGVLAAIALIKRFLGTLHVARKEPIDDSSEGDGDMELDTRPRQVQFLKARASTREDDSRDRASSNASQLKQFYPL